MWHCRYVFRTPLPRLSPLILRPEIYMNMKGAENIAMTALWHANLSAEPVTRGQWPQACNFCSLGVRHAHPSLVKMHQTEVRVELEINHSKYHELKWLPNGKSARSKAFACNWKKNSCVYSNIMNAFVAQWFTIYLIALTVWRSKYGMGHPPPVWYYTKVQYVCDTDTPPVWYSSVYQSRKFLFIMM